MTQSSESENANGIECTLNVNRNLFLIRLPQVISVREVSVTDEEAKIEILLLNNNERAYGNILADQATIVYIPRSGNKSDISIDTKSFKSGGSSRNSFSLQTGEFVDVSPFQKLARVGDVFFLEQTIDNDGELSQKAFTVSFASIDESFSGSISIENKLWDFVCDRNSLSCTINDTAVFIRPGYFKRDKDEAISSSIFSKLDSSYKKIDVDPQVSQFQSVDSMGLKKILVLL